MGNQPRLQKVSELPNLDRFKPSLFHEYTKYLLRFMTVIFATISEANNSMECFSFECQN